MSQNKEIPSDAVLNKGVNRTDSNNNDVTNSNQPLTHKKPGRLKGQVSLTLHTAYAQKLFLGFRPDKRSINLLQFGGRMTDIWDAAERDDPFADWYLLKVYDLLLKLKKQLTSEIEAYQAKLNQSNHLVSLTIKPFESEQPTVESIWFRTQYGYMAANLVAHFDELMRTVLTANRVGVLLDKPEKVIRQNWLDQILALFRLPFKWKPLSITRADIKAENEQATAAQGAMGDIPESILLLKLRSPFAPSIKAATIKEQETPHVNTT
jgi:integrating conjugative element protein (TIGR03761 family)